MLAADTDFQGRARLAASFGSHLDQLTHTFLVENGKRILLDDSLFKVRRQNLVDVVAREAPSGLREIVGTEREELGFFGNLRGDERGARQLDHGAHQVLYAASLLFE